MAYRGPSIDHSVLSPNGRISKRASAAKMAIEHAKLFDGLTVTPAPPATSKPSRIVRLQGELVMLRERAAAGDRPRFHNRRADLCERLIGQLQIEAA